MTKNNNFMININLLKSKLINVKAVMAHMMPKTFYRINSLSNKNKGLFGIILLKKMINQLSKM